MVCHVVFYRLKPGSTGADEARLVDEAQRRLPLLPGVRNLRAGKNMAPAENGYSVALVMDFEDGAALEAYRVHPDHQFFVQQIAGPLVSEIWRYDFRWE